MLMSDAASAQSNCRSENGRAQISPVVKRILVFAFSCRALSIIANERSTPTTDVVFERCRLNLPIAHPTSRNRIPGLISSEPVQQRLSVPLELIDTVEQPNGIEFQLPAENQPMVRMAHCSGRRLYRVTRTPEPQQENDPCGIEHGQPGE